MAKKEVNTSGKSNFGNIQFWNIPLGKDDQKWLASNASVEEFPLELLCELVAQGFKISFSNDSKNHSFICTITLPNGVSEGKSLAVSSRGSTALNAWFSAAYKHIHILRGDWDSFETSANDSSSDFG